jgi:hypothetical protein
MPYLTDSIEKYDQFIVTLQETKRQVEIAEICCDDSNTSCNLQIKHEEELAKELEKQLNKPVEVNFFILLYVKIKAPFTRQDILAWHS